MSLTKPAVLMRKPLHNTGVKIIYLAVAAGSAGGLAAYYGYAEPRRKAIEEYHKNYDPYEHQRWICSYPIKFMSACPSNLVAAAEEKGMRIGTLDEPFRIPIMQHQEEESAEEAQAQEANSNGAKTVVTSAE
ncbi:cytochrome c oxidase subunit VIc domain-containing protein [Ditylenchus destructor]|uniref:Cytochrome c oxidase subunit VIc domain-containing protein n=1 Tax=Ditylenchus destructor TaxID=166010 RepID=A0AAD4N759_9BILA|nr:cytochrome c oxidase subunit VIc domain-containing protein [Ditylenchus destructor]